MWGKEHKIKDISKNYSNDNIARSVRYVKMMNAPEKWEGLTTLVLFDDATKTATMRYEFYDTLEEAKEKFHELENSLEEGIPLVLAYHSKQGEVTADVVY